MRSLSEVVLKPVYPFQQDLLKGNVFLLLIEPENIPPHLGLIVNGSYYSISVKGVRSGTNAENLINSLIKKSKKALFVQLNNWQPDPNELMKIFSSYSAPDGLKITCLSPILDALEQEMGSEVRDCSFVFELIPFLEVRGKVGLTFQLGMEKLIKDGAFSLTKYKLEDIRNCILDLKGETAQ